MEIDKGETGDDIGTMVQKGIKMQVYTKSQWTPYGGSR